MRLGVKGCVSGLANAIPEIVLRIHGATVAGQPEQAQQATEQVVELMNLADVLEFPLNVAAAMEARGLTVGHPKAAVSLATAQKYRRVVAQLQRLYQEWALS
jgi:dihydrodipicolinate synthase/N-acetylneuraminate lyase